MISNMTFWLYHAIGTSISVTCQWHHQLHHAIPQVKTTEMRCNKTFWWHLMPLALATVSYDAYGMVNGTIAFLRSRQLK